MPPRELTRTLANHEAHLRSKVFSSDDSSGDLDGGVVGEGLGGSGDAVGSETSGLKAYGSCKTGRVVGTVS